ALGNECAPILVEEDARIAPQSGGYRCAPGAIVVAGRREVLDTQGRRAGVKAPLGDRLVGRAIDWPECGETRAGPVRIEKHAPATRRIRRERSLRRRAIAEAAILDHDGLRALQQIGRKTIGRVLPPDRDERAGTRAAIERHPRDGVVLLTATDHHE